MGSFILREGETTIQVTEALTEALGDRTKSVKQVIKALRRRGLVFAARADEAYLVRTSLAANPDVFERVGDGYRVRKTLSDRPSDATEDLWVTNLTVVFQQVQFEPFYCGLVAELCGVDSSSAVQMVRVWCEHGLVERLPEKMRDRRSRPVVAYQGTPRMEEYTITAPRDANLQAAFVREIEKLGDPEDAQAIQRGECLDSSCELELAFSRALRCLNMEETSEIKAVFLKPSF